MRNLVTIICIVLGLAYGGLAQAASFLDGRWISTEIENRNQDTGIGAGWTVLFQPDGTFSEEIDEGFGIVEEWTGSFSLIGEKLLMHRTGFRQPWEFQVKHERKHLVISRIWEGEPQYTVTFKRSDDVHPALAQLPRWPKTKADAVAILKQKLSAEDLQKLAATPKDQLAMYHFGLGMYIRNGFGVWRGNKDLWNDLTHGEPRHPDDLSGMIIEALWEDLNGQSAQPIAPGDAPETARP